jgi:phosphoribosylformylglycinamidine synthase
LGTPVTGGNVSFYNETRGKAIYPTPVIGMLGVLEEVERAIGAAFHRAGNVVVLLGGGSQDLPDAVASFSSTEYARAIRGVVAGAPPAIDLAREKRVEDCCLELIRRGYVQAAHDVSDGGLLVALAECCLAAGERLGGVVTLASALPLEVVCFGEEPSRILLEVDEVHLADLLRVAAQYGVEGRQLGWTTAGEFRLHFNGGIVLEEPIERLADAWRNSLARQFEGVSV